MTCCCTLGMDPPRGGASRPTRSAHLFRKAFHLDHAPASAILVLTADDFVSNVFVNGSPSPRGSGDLPPGSDRHRAVATGRLQRDRHPDLQCEGMRRPDLRMRALLQEQGATDWSKATRPPECPRTSARVGKRPRSMTGTGMSALSSTGSPRRSSPGARSPYLFGAPMRF